MSKLTIENDRAENDTKNSRWAESVIFQVNEFFKTNLPLYNLTDKSWLGPHWKVQYQFQDVSIHVGGDIGFTIEIMIGEQRYSLWQYDRSVNNMMDTNEKNVLSQLKILKRFLDEVQM